MARTLPELLASRVVDQEFMPFPYRLPKRDPTSVTVFKFWREITKFSGFLTRKHEGEPGWQTLWRGWNYL